MKDLFIETEIAGRKAILCATHTSGRNFEKTAVNLSLQQYLYQGHDPIHNKTEIVKEEKILIGYSICNPNQNKETKKADVFDLDFGQKVAKGRTLKKPSFTIPWNDLFNKGIVMALLKSASRAMQRDPGKYIKSLREEYPPKEVVKIDVNIDRSWCGAYPSNMHSINN